MKNLSFILFVTILLSSCNSSVDSTVKVGEMDAFGATITADNAKPAADFKAEFLGADEDSVFAKLSGPVDAVCKKKGCWMTMNLGGEDELFIKFKDYDFFVPLNCEGREAIVEGWAYKEEMSVEELQHYAEDEGQSSEEIAAITEPEVSFTFMADGVLMK